jgi:hypothetical protein
MPEADRGPVDPSFDRERLAATLDDIDGQGQQELDVLLADLLRVCWPNIDVQNQ